MSNEELLDFATNQGHEVLNLKLCENKAFTISGNRCYIAVAQGLPLQEEKQLIAHELGHCEHGCLYCQGDDTRTKARAEYRATKWAYYMLVPPDEIAEYVNIGIVTPWALAEQFDVDVEFMTRALEYYRSLGVI